MKLSKDTKLIFFDIDGTLWDFTNKISDSTVSAIKAAKKRGHKLFLNSGRARGYIIDEGLLSLGFDGIVGGCGTTIEYDNSLIFSSYISNKLLEKSLNIMADFGFRTILEGYEALYMNAPEWENDPYYRKLFRDLRDNIKSISENWGSWDKICKFSVDAAKGDLSAGMEALSRDFSFIVHNESVVEVVPIGYSKASGIKYICEYLGVERENTFAFGDSINDTDMINYAGVGIAMGNGVKDIKDAADYVTDSIYEDGIYNAMSRYDLI